MAEVIFDKFSKHKASSVGIKVSEKEGQKIKDILEAGLVIESMKKEGFDISENTRKQLRPEMLNQFDKIIVMAEKEIVPEYLKNNSRVEFWDIKDPKNVSKEEHYKIVKKIKELVKDFIKRNNL